MSVQPTRGTYSNQTIKLTNCSNYALSNLGDTNALLISNKQGDSGPESTTVKAGGSYSSPTQNAYNYEYGDIIINGATTDFTIECSPGTIVTIL